MGLSGSQPERNDPYAAYCLDEAVYTFGQWVDQEIEKAQSGAKNNREAEARVKHRIRSIFAEQEQEEGAPPAPGTFRDPAKHF